MLAPGNARHSTQVKVRKWDYFFTGLGHSCAIPNVMKCTIFIQLDFVKFPTVLGQSSQYWLKQYILDLSNLAGTPMNLGLTITNFTFTQLDSKRLLILLKVMLAARQIPGHSEALEML